MATLKILFSQNACTSESPRYLDYLEGELQAPEVLCRVCQGCPPFNAGGKIAIERNPGTMYFLPAKESLQRQDELWAANQQSQLNDGAFKHPCIVLCQSLCGHLVLCAPCTSFGGRDIMEKMKSAHPDSDNLYRYLAVQGRNGNSNGNKWLPAQERMGTKAHHNSLEPLELVASHAKQQDKTTYAGVCGSFWLEKWALDDFNGKAKTLTTKSLAYLRWLVSLVECNNLLLAKQQEANIAAAALSAWQAQYLPGSPVYSAHSRPTSSSSDSTEYQAAYADAWFAPQAAQVDAVSYRPAVSPPVGLFVPEQWSPAMVTTDYFPSPQAYSPFAAPFVPQQGAWNDGNMYLPPSA